MCIGRRTTKLMQNVQLYNVEVTGPEHMPERLADFEKQGAKVLQRFHNGLQLLQRPELASRTTSASRVTTPQNRNPQWRGYRGTTPTQLVVRPGRRHEGTFVPVETSRPFGEVLPRNRGSRPTLVGGYELSAACACARALTDWLSCCRSSRPCLPPRASYMRKLSICCTGEHLDLDLSSPQRCVNCRRPLPTLVKAGAQMTSRRLSLRSHAARSCRCLH
jgi:hypothetical protein